MCHWGITLRMNEQRKEYMNKYILPQLLGGDVLLTWLSASLLDTLITHSPHSSWVSFRKHNLTVPPAWESIIIRVKSHSLNVAKQSLVWSNCRQSLELSLALEAPFMSLRPFCLLQGFVHAVLVYTVRSALLYLANTYSVILQIPAHLWLPQRSLPWFRSQPNFTCIRVVLIVVVFVNWCLYSSLYIGIQGPGPYMFSLSCNPNTQVEPSL